MDTRARRSGLDLQARLTVAAAAATLDLDLPLPALTQALKTAHVSFGRMEVVAAPGRELVIALLNNSAGCGQVLRTLLDGLAGEFAFLATAGLPAQEMAMRLKYAGFPPERVAVEADPARPLDRALAVTPDGGRLRLLPTYTPCWRRSASCRCTAGACPGPSGRSEEAMEIRICHLYPDLLNLYGDRGNNIALARRAEWRGSGPP